MTGTIAKFMEPFAKFVVQRSNIRVPYPRNFANGSSEKKWQARRDSNPQHPVLETGALPVRATGLQREPIGKNFLVTAISDPLYRVSR